MKHRFYGLRGVDLAKDFAQKIKNNQSKSCLDGKFTPRDFGELCNKYKLWPKTLNEFLAKLGLMKASTWEKLKSRGATAKFLGVDWSHH